MNMASSRETSKERERERGGQLYLSKSTAIHPNDLPIDPFPSVRGQEASEAADVGGQADAFERGEHGGALDRILC